MAFKPPRAMRPGQPTNERQRKAAYDRTRPSASIRGYDNDWHHLRADFLRSHFVCSVLGCGASATEVHHIKRVRHRPDLRLDPSNLAALCRYHHSRVTAIEDGWARTIKDKRIR